MKIRAKNQQNRDKKIQRISETKSWFCEKINKILKPPVNLTRRSRERSKLIKLDINEGYYNKYQLNTEEHQGILQNPIIRTMENLEEMDKILDAFDQPKLNPQKTDRSITSNEIEE
jgi:hypothetical protein